MPNGKSTPVSISLVYYVLSILNLLLKGKFYFYNLGQIIFISAIIPMGYNNVLFTWYLMRFCGMAILVEQCEIGQETQGIRQS